MWILRNKLFRRDYLPDEKFGPNREIEEKYNVDFYIDIQSTKKYDTQLEKSLYKDIVKKLRKDIKDGYIYTDGPTGGDTHFLSDFSHKDSHVLSKKINDEDRLNYRIYRPTLIQKSDGLYYYSMKIVLESCSGHELNGTPDYVKNKTYKNLKQNKNSRRN